MKGYTDEQELPQLNLPLSKMKLKMEEGVIKVYDPLRYKYVILTPEEYVRQQFMAWMHLDRHYPVALMANEMSLNINGNRNRSDSVIFGRDGKPLIIIEYKAPDIKITQSVFDQIVRYNMSLRAGYLIVSNGLTHYCCRINYEAGDYYFIPMIPDYTETR